MKYLYDFTNHQVLMSEEAQAGYEAISAQAFSAYFETQSKNSGSGLYFRKNQNRLELVRRNGDEPVDADAANLLDIVWIDGQGFLPAQPSAAHGWDGKAWVVHSKQVADELLAALKADLCAKIDARAVEVGDSTVKSSVYLSSEYQRNASDAQAWKDAGYTGEPPLSVKTGAESHGLTYQEEAELILRESAMAEGFIETLRTWRMTAKGVQGIQGTHTATDAQAVFDAAMLALNNQLAAMKG
jgi:hypothetical protein